MAERQRFTIARDQAIAKMREYAMRHPDQYVLELIQAAVFRGARWISVDATPTESLVTWVGAPPVPHTELEQLFDYLFVAQTRAETRSLQQLALGVNALLFRKPRSLVIESGDGRLRRRFGPRFAETATSQLPHAPPSSAPTSEPRSPSRAGAPGRLPPSPTKPP